MDHCTVMARVHVVVEFGQVIVKLRYVGVAGRLPPILFDLLMTYYSAPQSYASVRIDLA